MPRLAIHAQDRLCAAKADQHPAAVFELELEAIHGDEFGHFQAAECFGFVIQDDFLARGLVAAEGTVHAVIEIFAAHFGEQDL